MKSIKNNFIKISIIAILSMNLYSAEEFTGDTKLACEALLCLSTPKRPTECIPSIKKFFSFKARKFYKVVEMRKNFLNLCPAGNELEEQKNSLARLTGNCDIDELNKKIESQVISISNICDDGYCQEIKNYGYRINPTLDKNCRILSSLQYSNYKLQYVCPKNFYNSVDWKNGYTLKEVSKSTFDNLNSKDRIQSSKNTTISYREYAQLPKEKRKMCKSKYKFSTYCRIDDVYYEKIYINKKCWINKE